MLENGVGTSRIRSKARPGDARVRLLRLTDLDRRTGSYRQTVELVEALEEDQGGSDNLSTGRRQLIEAAAVASAMRKDWSARWMAGEPISVTEFCTVLNAERRAYEAIGCDRVARDVTPTLEAIEREYAAQTPSGEPASAPLVRSNGQAATLATPANERTGEPSGEGFD